MPNTDATIERKYQVFISSTFSDLAVRRQEAIDVIVDAGHIPVALERYPAADDNVPGVVKKTITRCQLYILILGHRYGSISPDGRRSFTELEYEFARENGLTILPFVMHDEDVAELRGKLRKSRKAADKVEQQNEEAFVRFRNRVMAADQHYCRVFRKDIGDFKYHAVKSLTKAEDECKLRGWVREPEEDEFRGALASISRNPFIIDVVQALSSLEILDKRVIKEDASKEALARCFGDLYLQQIIEKRCSLFFESGSTLAYVAEEVGPALSKALKLDENGIPEVGVSTNNVLAYLLLWLKHRIPCTLFPWGAPETTYGASLGPLDIDIHSTPAPAYPPRALDSTAQMEIEKLMQSVTNVPRWTQNTLLLGATSGLQMTGKFNLKERASATSGISECGGPHVGSYKNKVFKRFMYQSKYPLMIFLTADKIDCEIEIGKCHFMFDNLEAWETFMREYPLAFGIGCDNRDRQKRISFFKNFGFEPAFRQTATDKVAFIARNQRFIDQFEKPMKLDL